MFGRIIPPQESFSLKPGVYTSVVTPNSELDFCCLIKVSARFQWIQTVPFIDNDYPKVLESMRKSRACRGRAAPVCGTWQKCGSSPFLSEGGFLGSGKKVGTSHSAPADSTEKLETPGVRSFDLSKGAGSSKNDAPYQIFKYWLD